MPPRTTWLVALLLVACRFELPEPSALHDAADGSAADQGTWRWQAVALPFANTIHGLWGERGDLWAVGNGGLIAHHDGQAWSKRPSPTGEDLRAVWGPSQDDLWAVGNAGTILRYGSGAWTLQSSPVASALYGVWGSGATDVWAVGDAGVVLHHDGASWTAATAGSADLRAVWGSAAADVWAVGAGGALLQNQGGGWTAGASGVTRTLFGIWGRSSQAIWAVGAGGSVLRFDGGAWTSEVLDSAASYRAAGGASTAGPGVEAWIVGDRAGQGVIYGLQGGSWTSAGSYPGTILHAVWVAPTGEAWAAGGGQQQALRYGP